MTLDFSIKKQMGLLLLAMQLNALWQEGNAIQVGKSWLEWSVLSHMWAPHIRTEMWHHPSQFWWVIQSAEENITGQSLEAKDSYAAPIRFMLTSK